ncbi:MAG: isochorismatase family protein, partial [Deltaproteobacteria bacterium]|nr:isochorismatase family protein [Deltaproteobacteria bacterium]
IHPSVSPTDGEAVIRKHHSSAFESTNLRQVLEERDIDTVISCGLQSEHCITNTSISALELGLDVIVAEDGHSTWTTDQDEASAIVERQNTLLRHRGARIEPVRALVQWLSNP